MAIFINILILFLFCLTFIVSYFIIGIFITSRFFIQLKLPVQIIEFIKGTLYSSIAIIFQFWMQNSNQMYSPYLFIAIGLSISFFNSAIVSCYSLIGIILFTLFFFNNTDYDNLINFYYILSLTFASMIIINISSNFFKQNTTLFLLFIFLLSNLVIFWVISTVITGILLNKFFIISSVLPFIISLIIIFGICRLTLFFESATSLYKSSKYVHGNYFREGHTNFEIQKHIKKYNLNQGIFLLFQIKWDITNKKTIKKLTPFVLSNLENSLLKKGAIFFKVDSNKWGLFIKTKEKIVIKNIINNNSSKNRIGRDALSIIENKITKISKFYKLKNSLNGATATVKGGAIIYGIQECSIQKMIEKSALALKNAKWHNTLNNVTLYDPALERNKIRDYKDIEILVKNIDIPFISQKYYPIININNKNTICNYAKTIIASGGLISLDGSFKYAKEIGKLNILKKYISAKSIISSNSWTNNKIAFQYHASIINSIDFNAEEFISSIHRFKQSALNLICLLNINSLLKVNKKEIMISKINYLKNLGMTFGIINCDRAEKIKKVEWIDFEYIFLDLNDLNKSELKKTLSICKQNNITSIAHKISSLEELKMALEFKINNVGGSLFNKSELYPTNFNKKDKIYIEYIKNKGGE
ncbi:MAG: hypothetical protein GY679_00585 [Mycoplasma sp.]|nr:hypothetical protein [Mycoplasma sp.]